MKIQFSRLLLVGMILVLAVGLSAGDLDTKGKAWLDSHNEPPAINVAGNWHAKEWGKIVLRQAPDSRELMGDGDGWDITGVVSGNRVFLLFSNKGKVTYSAVLTSQPDNTLNGSYGKGFIGDMTKGKSIIMIKQ